MEIRQALHDFIMNEAPNRILDGFDDTFNLIDSGLMDSLFMMRIITYIEEQYQIEFTVDDFAPEYFQSVTTLSEFVNSKLASGA